MHLDGEDSSATLHHGGSANDGLFKRLRLLASPSFTQIGHVWDSDAAATEAAFIYRHVCMLGSLGIRVAAYDKCVDAVGKLSLLSELLKVFEVRKDSDPKGAEMALEEFKAAEAAAVKVVKAAVR